MPETAEAADVPTERIPVAAAPDDAAPAAAEATSETSAEEPATEEPATEELPVVAPLAEEIFSLGTPADDEPGRRG